MPPAPLSRRARRLQRQTAQLAQRLELLEQILDRAGVIDAVLGGLGPQVDPAPINIGRFAGVGARIAGGGNSDPAPDDLGRGTLATASMLGSRGCPWNCSFCSIRPLYEAQGGALRRLRRPEAVAAEMVALQRERDAGTAARARCGGVLVPGRRLPTSSSTSASTCSTTGCCRRSGGATSPTKGCATSGAPSSSSST